MFIFGDDFFSNPPEKNRYLFTQTTQLNQPEDQEMCYFWPYDISQNCNLKIEFDM